MIKVTEDNYHTFLSYHGRDIDVARYVVDTYNNTDTYKSIEGVRVWVEASKIVIKLYEQNRLV